MKPKNVYQTYLKERIGEFIATLDGSGKKLGTRQGDVILDGDDICICVKMIISNHLHRAGDDVVGGVFDDFKFFFY